MRALVARRLDGPDAIELVETAVPMGSWTPLWSESARRKQRATAADTCTCNPAHVHRIFAASP
jgi:hypothetical protein